MEIPKLVPETLTTERLCLRPFRFSDVPAFHAYLSEPDMGTFLEGERSSFSESDAAAVIAKHLLADKSERQVWAITIEDIPIGAVTINFAKEHRVSELGYSVKKSLWGQGIAREAVLAVVNAAFEAYPQLQRIQANIHPDNEGSLRVAMAVGMQHEGTLKSYAFVNGKVADEAVYAIIRTLWPIQAQ